MQRRAYKIKHWHDAEDFLTRLAQVSGKLLKGGEPDLNTAAKMVLYDWQRGKIPFFVLPPGTTAEAPSAPSRAAPSVHPEQVRVSVLHQSEAWRCECVLVLPLLLAAKGLRGRDRQLPGHTGGCAPDDDDSIVRTIRI